MMTVVVAMIGRCVALRPEWEKGHYRLGAVCEQAGEWEEVRSLALWLRW
jgi:predicted TPR repeat methyltransferase